MSSRKKYVWVSFTGNSKVDGAFFGEENHKEVQVGQPVKVLAQFEDHLINGGLARKADAPKKDTANLKEKTAAPVTSATGGTAGPVEAQINSDPAATE